MNQDNEHTKIKNNIANTFNDVASDYYHNKQFILSAKRVVLILKENDISNSSNILDLSSGTGNIAIEIAKQYPNTSIYGVDISKEMLIVAQAKIDTLNIKNITLHV